MAKASLTLEEVTRILRASYGKPPAPVTKDPFEMVLWENVAYLVGDDRRAEAFSLLKRQIGTRPEAILAATDADLMTVARAGGMLAEQRAERLRRIAEIAVARFGGDLASVLEEAPAVAIKKLMTFPGIGRPGAEKILLFSGAHPILALESNGLRVLLRLGIGSAGKSYAAGYRSAQEAAMAGAGTGRPSLIAAHQLLRRHGQETCKTSTPMCGRCPLAVSCKFHLEGET